MFLARLCYIFGGSEIYRLPYIHLLQNNSAPMDRSKNSIQMGYQCKNPFVCCLFIFFYIFVSRSFPLPSTFPSTDIERGKVSGWILSAGGRFWPKRLAAPTFQLSRADVLSSQTSKGEERMTESVNFIYRRFMIDQIQILHCNNEKSTAFLLVHKKVVPLCIRSYVIDAKQ